MKMRELSLDLHLFVQVSIYEDTSAMLTHDDFLALADLALALGRDDVETAAAGIAQYRHHSQAIAVALADTLIGA